MKAKDDYYDVSAQLDQEFGTIGTKEREDALNQAWEEYNAQILLDARKQAGLTQKQLAQRIGSDKGYISKLERGLITPNISTLYKIASAMGYRVELRPAF